MVEESSNYSLGLLDDYLGPIVQRANTCIDKELLEVTEDDGTVLQRDKEPWKAVFLAFIVFKMVYRLVGLCH